MDSSIVEPETRSNRFWLYTPIILLILIAAGWSIAWHVIRDRAVEGLDQWLAVEARAGRQWTCQDRAVGGYPFEINVRCASLNLKQGPVTASLGAFRSVAQVYQPRFVITEIDGPLQLTDGAVTVRGTWDLLQSSLHGSPNGLQRASVVVNNPTFTVTGLAPTDLVTSSQHLEVHLRPNPSRVQEGAYDVAISAKQAKIPVLDHLVGGGEATDFQMDVTATQAQGFRGRPVAEELERWRKAGGKVDILMLSLAKGSRRVEAKGEVGLDEFHRPTGQLSLAAAGLDGLLSNVMGGRAGGALLGALFGQGAPAPGQPAAPPKLVTLPPLLITNGHLAFGPFVLPNVQIQPIY